MPLIAKEHPLRPRKREEAKSLNEHLRQAGETALLGGEVPVVTVLDASTLPPVPSDSFVTREASAGDASSVDALLAERERWLGERQRAISTAGNGLRVVTATSLKPEWEAIASQNEVRRGNAVEFGIAVHAALERVPLEDAAAIDGVCAAVAREAGFEERLADLTACVRNGLASTIVARALRAQRILREAPFTVAAAGGGMAEGRIDLLFIEDGGVVVVDFKSDNVSAPEAAARTQQAYRAQALAYAWAAHEATGLPVREVVFLYVRIPHEEVIAVDDAFMREADSLIAAPAFA